MHSAASDSSSRTPVSFSSFSPQSVSSNFTSISEDQSDLGAFSNVFRALNELQRNRPSAESPLIDLSSPTILASPSNRVANVPSPSSDTESPPDSVSTPSTVYNADLTADEDYDSEGYRVARHRRLRSDVVDREHRLYTETVWAQEPVAHYLTASGKSDYDEDSSTPVPSLGAFENALVFLAAERARLSNKLDEAVPPLHSLTDSSGSNSAGDKTKGQTRQAVDLVTGSGAGMANAPQKRATTRPKRKGKNERQKERAARELQAIIDGVGMDGNESRNELAGDVSSSYEEAADDSQDEERTARRLRPKGLVGHELIVPIFRQRKASKHKTKSSSEAPIAPNIEARHAPVQPSKGSLYDDLSPLAAARHDHLLHLSSKLSEQFPADTKSLSSLRFVLDRFALAGMPKDHIDGQRVLLSGTDGSGYWQTNAAEDDKGRVHVFVDHSNILVGFLEWTKKQFSKQSSSYVNVAGITTRVRGFQGPKKPRMSHASLVLLLERGRRIGKRVLVASSPLHQDLDDVVDLGYEVSVLQRVAIREGDSGADQARNPNSRLDSGRFRPAFEANSGGSSTEGHHGAPSSSSRAAHGRDIGHRRHESAPSTSLFDPLSSTNSVLRGYSQAVSAKHSAVGDPVVNGGDRTFPSAVFGGARTRFREEAVDELIQLKLLQTLISSNAPAPRGSTIVLATGDGASSQFNREGFLGCVRQAIDRGWRVELVGWQEGRSRAWVELANEVRERKRLSGSSSRGGLYMISLEQWAWDLYDEKASC